jgi:hypothetical protein
VSSAGEETVDLAREAGLITDPWQELVLYEAMGEDVRGKWAAMEVGLCVPRQNGKGGILEARELGGLFLINELIVHTAHQFETSLAAFARLLELIESNPWLVQQVRRVSRAHGEEGIKLRNGSQIKFKTRTKSGGRGLSGDLVILDEAMILSEYSVGALLPLLSARKNPQLWYTGSAVDADVHDAGRVFAGIRERGLAGGDPSLVYIEYSCKPGADPTDPREWARANPALGIRISPEYVANEYRTLRHQGNTFPVERLGIGNWPKADEEVKPAFDPNRWVVLKNRDPEFAVVPKRKLPPLCIALDETPDLNWVTIAAAALLANGNVHIEVGFHQAPVALSIVSTVVGLVGRWDPVAVVFDRKSPIASIEPDLIARGLEPETTTPAQMTSAMGGLFQASKDGTVSHTGDPLLLDAVKGSTWREVSGTNGGRALTRIGGTVISPLVASGLARWGLIQFNSRVPAAPPPAPVLDTLPAEAGALSGNADNLMTTGF